MLSCREGKVNSLMQPFDLDLLINPGLVIFTATLLVAFHVTRSLVLSLTAALVKAAIFLMYFGVLFDGTFTFLDDWSYLNRGMVLVEEEVGLFNLADKWDFALMTAGGDHVLYYLYNAYALRFFGEGYYAPVALNIVLTALIAWFGALVGEREFGLTGHWKKIFFMFLLFHPDILAWSNVINAKDILILLLHVLLLLSVSLFLRGERLKALAIAIPVSTMFFFLRFYVPAFFAVILVAHQLRGVNNRNRLFFLFGSAAISLFVIDAMIGHLIPYALSSLQENLVNPVRGFVRMVFTPIPFHTDVESSFLDVPALMHWMMMPLALYGAVLLVRRKDLPFIRFFIVYLVVFMGFYSVYGELQGPRHRVQLDFAFATLQFVGIRQCLIWVFASRRGENYRPIHLKCAVEPK